MNDFLSFITHYDCSRVLANVSCEVVQPKQIRPNEGTIYINLEISPMAAPQFEANRQTEFSVYLNRLLEKCYKDSKCVDLESLCIVVEEKVIFYTDSMLYIYLRLANSLQNKLFILVCVIYRLITILN